MERLHYSKAPITEAIIDFRVRPREGLTLSDVEQVRRGEEQAYPDVRRLTIVHGLIEGGVRVGASATKEETGFAFSSADKKQILQSRIDGFTFSRLAPYNTWESFRDEGRRLWMIYRDRVSPAEVTRLAVRYINRFDLPGTKVELKDYFRTSPEISPDLNQSLSGFFLRTVARAQERCVRGLYHGTCPETNPLMATIALQPLQPLTALVLSIFDDDRALPMPQGREGQSILAAAFEAAEHWTARPSCVLEIPQTEDLYTYDLVPLNVVGTICVKYRFSGRLQPRPYRVE